MAHKIVDMNHNPLLNVFAAPFESAPFHLIHPDHYLPALHVAIGQGHAEVNSIVANTRRPNFENVVEALERAGKSVGRISSILFNLNHAETSEAIQDVARKASPLLTAYSNDIWLNDALFAKVKEVYDHSNVSDLETDAHKLLVDTYHAFVRKGALLSEAQKERYRQITGQLSELTLQFGENVLAETNHYFLHLTQPADLEGLPKGVVEAAAQSATHKQLEGWVFTLQAASYLPFLKHACNRVLREQMFKAYTSRGNQPNNRNNTALIEQIVNLRQEKAALLGYDSHAQYVLEERMAKNTETVNRFLTELLEAAWPYAQKEVKEVEVLAQRDGIVKLERWDFAYYSEQLKTSQYQVNDEMTRPYFSLERVEQGIFELAGLLFGLQFRLRNDIPVYHPDVKTYEVTDRNHQHVALLYADYYPRTSKQGGAWMTSFRDQYRCGETDTRPHTSMVCNFTPPTPENPSLLTFNEVKTFLHEFGHALHGMLSRVRYESQSGTSVYRDFVELPSQLMENWATEKQWLNRVAIHHQTGEPIPMEWIDRLIAADLFQSGYGTVRQLSFGLLDMAYHSQHGRLNQPVPELEQKAIATTELFPPVPGSSVSTAFAHIFDGGYAAGYYGYKWAEVLDADAFESFQEAGIFDPSTALRYQTSILEKGGSAHPMALYLAFKGREPKMDALLKRSGLRG